MPIRSGTGPCNARSGSGREPLNKRPQKFATYTGSSDKGRLSVADGDHDPMLDSTHDFEYRDTDSSAIGLSPLWKHIMLLTYEYSARLGFSPAD